jgi:hypothetical protein
MQTHTPQSVDELHTILGEARQHHAHCVAPAWITPTAPLYDVLINVFDYPRPDGREFGVDGLAGRAWTTPIRGVNIDENWHRIWKLCDQVNDEYEVGTLLPNYRLTLMPAYLITQPLNEDKVLQSVQEVLQAQHRFNIDAPIYVFSSASDKTPEGAHELLQQCLSEIKHPTTVLVEHVPGRDANPRSWVR